MTRNRGRKSKLTPARQQCLVHAIAQGCTYRTACQCVGIDYVTFYRWLQAGKAGDTRYTQFCNAIKVAEGIAVVRALEQIDAAAETDWRAAAWLLERTCPEHYGKRRVVDQHHTGNVQHGHVWLERLTRAHTELDARRNGERMLSVEPQKP